MPWGSTVRAPPNILHGKLAQCLCIIIAAMQSCYNAESKRLVQDTANQSLAKQLPKGLTCGPQADQTNSANDKHEVPTSILYSITAACGFRDGFLPFDRTLLAAQVSTKGY